MRNKLLIILMLLGLVVQAQKNTKSASDAPKQNGKGPTKMTIKLGKKDDVNEIVTLGEKGFILKTAVGYAGREKDIKLHFYKTDLSKRWSISLPKGSNKFLANYFVASKLTDYVYLIQTSKTFNTQNGKMIITRIDSVGKKTEFTYPIGDEMDDAVGVAVFENDEKLFFLVSKNKVTKEKKLNASGKKKNVNVRENKLLMFTMEHNKKTFSRKSTEVSLTSDDPSADLSIEFLGNDDENFYLAQKSVNLGSGKTSYKIYTMTNDGEIDETIDIDAKLKYTPIPAKNLRECHGSEIYDNDYEIRTETRGNKTYITYIAKAGSFGCSQLDIENGHFYIYGLAVDKVKTDKKGRSDNIMYIAPNSIYVQKFDLFSGELLGDYYGALPKGMKEDKLFSTSVNFLGRAINFNIVDSGMVRLNILGGKSTHVISMNLIDEKVTSASREIRPQKGGGLYHQKFLAALLVTPADGNKEMVNYVKKFPDFRAKEYSVFGVFLGNRTAVVQNFAFTKNPRLEFVIFNNSIRGK